MSRQGDLDRAIDMALDGLQTAVGLTHCMAFLADHERQVLTAIASRGYDRQGAGAEVHFGEGVVGMAAAGLQALRFSCVVRHFLYMNGVKAADLFSPDPERRIPMPGLDAPQSLLAVPMIAGGELRGLIFAEDIERLAFSPDDTRAVELIAAQLGAIVALSYSGPEPEPNNGHTAHADRVAFVPQTPIRVEHYSYDDSVFINRDYVIKGVPGRLLWRMLSDNARDGRTEFTNREFRLDGSLKLPDYKDNLETRLLLLGRRLAENDWPVRIERIGRGRLGLIVRGTLVLTEHP
ncbi:MAG: GAF domain-containing protein [Tabrizicola sp.]|nr:GAF domain-containing protein [Tabrizicola sp.]